MLDKSLKSKLASAIADDALFSACLDELWSKTTDQVLDVLRVKQAKSGKLDDEHIVRHFESLFKAQGSDEKRFKDMVVGVWDKERRIILSNLKKLKHFYQKKDVIDSILYPIRDFEKMLSDESRKLYIAMILKYGNREIAEYNLDISFDVQNPNVRDWIKEYTPKFSENLEAVNQEELRKQLLEGLDAGEGIPDLIKRVNLTYDNWDAIRSETIARSEVIRASNKGALESYRQSGVVEQKVWLVAPDERLCDLCEEMGNREPIGLDELYDTTYYGDIEAPPLHPRCYDDQTEVYTGRGWQLIKDIQIGDECLSLKPDDFNLEYLPAIKTYQFFSSHMIHFSNRNFDLMVTEDHNIFYQTDWNSKYNKNRWQFVKAMDLINKKSGVMYRSSRWTGKEIDKIIIGNLSIKTDVFCRLMGYYLSEGNVSKRKNSYQIGISQYVIPQQALMHSDLSEMPIKVSRGKTKLYLFNIDLGKYLEQFGKSQDKYVPKEIKELPTEYIDIFLDAYCLGDGYIKRGRFWKGGQFKDNRVFCTSSKKMADDLGELLIKVGKRPSYKFNNTKGKLHQFRNGQYRLNTDTWIISECHSQRTTMAYMKKEKVEYNKMSYCIDLPRNHTLLIRRNGKVVWSGNCRCAIAPWMGE